MILSEKLEKTTKSNFINDITKNKSLFLGKSYSNVNMEKLDTVINTILKDISDGVDIPFRTCTNNNYKLTFSDNSKFYINRNTQTVYVYTYNNCKVYVIHEVHNNDIDDKFSNSIMVYFIAN